MARRSRKTVKEDGTRTEGFRDEHGEHEGGGGSSRWLSGTLVLCVVIFAALRGWYGLALVAVCAALGPFLGLALSRLFRRRRALLAVAVALGVVGVAVAILGLLGLTPFAEVGGVALWAPLAALLLAAVPKPILERERLKDADKMRMMLDLYPHPDGGRWTPEKMEAATDGELDARTCRYLLAGEGESVGSLGLSFEQEAAMARAMDFPMELQYRKIEWWEALYADWKNGADVSDKLQEWDCVTPERAAERLDIPTDDVMEMVAAGELEARRGRDGAWQIREHGVFENEILQRGKDPDILPPMPRHARPGRTGAANHLDRRGKPF